MARQLAKRRGHRRGRACLVLSCPVLSDLTLDRRVRFGALDQHVARQLASWWEGDRQDLMDGERSGAEPPITAGLGCTITCGEKMAAQRRAMMELPEALRSAVLVLSQHPARPMGAPGNHVAPARCFRGNGFVAWLALCLLHQWPRHMVWHSVAGPAHSSLAYIAST